MSLANVRKQLAEVHAKPAADTTRCSAIGCPMRGSVDVGGSGKFFCTAHGFSEPKKWPAITEGLIRNDWLIQLLTDLQMRFMAPDAQRSWLTMADEFFADQPDMQPSAYERANFPQYMTRLRMHLEYLAGSRSKRPGPLEPQGKGSLGKGGNIAEAL